ncbi:diguanylate cyclase [Candidatus Omnitrophota bacterium]
MQVGVIDKEMVRLKTKGQLEKELLELRTKIAERELFAMQKEWTYGRIKSEIQKLDSVINGLPNGVCIISRDCKVLFQNKWLTDRFQDKVDKFCFQRYMKKGKLCTDCPIKKAIKESHTEEREVTWTDGKSYKLIAVPLGKFEGKLSGVAIITDVTEQRRAEAAFLQSQQKYADLVNNINVGVYRNTPGPHGHFLEANPAMVLMFEAKSKQDLLAHRVSELYQDQKKRKQFSEKLMKHGFAKNEESRLVTLKGRKFWGAITSVKKEDRHGNVYFDGIVEDITERKWSERELIKKNRMLKQLTLKDSRTGLYNHRYLEDFIESEFHRAQRYDYPLSVIMLDIDYFKSVNDVYGHQFGDLILRQLAGQLKKELRRSDIIVRFGGEEFIVISPGVGRPNVMLLAKRILNSVKGYNFGNKRSIVRLKLSGAVASFPEDEARKGIDLIKLTDRILKKAKEEGGDRIYSSAVIKQEQVVLPEKEGQSPDVLSIKNKIDKLSKRINNSLLEEISAFGKLNSLKDGYTGRHVEKTIQYAAEVAGLLGMPQEKIEQIRKAYILHDLGKAGISKLTLRKKTKLNAKEFKEIRRHTQIGADIIKPIQFLRGIVPSILYHHERWDAKGYPEGLGKEQIPLGARVVSVVDAYQALTSDRSYRKAYSRKEAVKIIKHGSGKQFDPKVVKAFLEILQVDGARA